MRRILGDRYHLLEAGNAQQTMLLLAQNRDCIAAVVLDVSPSDLLTLDLLGQTQWQQEIGQTPVIVLVTADSPEMIRRGFELGAADVMALGEESLALRHRIETASQLYLHRQHLAQMVQEQADERNDGRCAGGDYRVSQHGVRSAYLTHSPLCQDPAGGSGAQLSGIWAYRANDCDHFRRVRAA